MVVAGASAASAQVELEVAGTGRHTCHRRLCFLRERCSAQVRVDDDAGRVQYTPQLGREPRARALNEVNLICRASEQLCAPGIEFGASHRSR